MESEIQETQSFSSKCNNSSIPFLIPRFYLVGVGGTLMALTSIVFSLMLMCTFFSRQYFRNTQFLYCACIALCDVLNALCYIGFMSVEVVTEFTKSRTLSMLWHRYLLYLFPLGHILTQTTTYLLVAVSLERLLSSLKWVTMDKKKRLIAAAGMFVFSIICKGTILFEIKTAVNTDCLGTIREFKLEATQLYLNPHYQSIWCFWFRTIVTIFIPFTVLSGTNLFVLVQQKCINSRTSRGGLVKLLVVANSPNAKFERGGTLKIHNSLHAWLRSARKRLRKSATRTMVAIMIEYLVCAGFVLTITIWEFINEKSLHSAEPFYTLSSDVISLLVVVNSLMRLPTYCICDVTFREDIKSDLRRLLFPRKKPPQPEPGRKFAEVVLIKHNVRKSTQKFKTLASRDRSKASIVSNISQRLSLVLGKRGTPVAKRRQVSRKNGVRSGSVTSLASKTGSLLSAKRSTASLRSFAVTSLRSVVSKNGSIVSVIEQN